MLQHQNGVHNNIEFHLKHDRILLSRRVKNDSELMYYITLHNEVISYINNVTTTPDRLISILWRQDTPITIYLHLIRTVPPKKKKKYNIMPLQRRRNTCRDFVIARIIILRDFLCRFYNKITFSYNTTLHSFSFFKRNLYAKFKLFSKPSRIFRISWTAKPRFVSWSTDVKIKYLTLERDFRTLIVFFFLKSLVFYKIFGAKLPSSIATRERNV